MDAWVTDLEKQMNEVHAKSWRTNSDPVSIFRVPPNLRWNNTKYNDPNLIYAAGPYDPRFVSIGPYHHGKKHLLPMEASKWCSLRKLVSKNDNPSMKMKSCLNALKDMEKNARSCYSEFIDMESDKFVEMLLLDGCFIVSILNSVQQELLVPSDRGDAEDDGGLIHSTVWIWGEVKKDLLLLENQIPFFVIRKLCELLINTVNVTSYPISLALDCLSTCYPGKMCHPKKNTAPSEEPCHLLHLFYFSILAPLPQSPFAGNSDTKEWIPSATRLKEAGIKLKVKDSNSFLDVAFHQGTLEIPALDLSNGSESVLRNLIAFEQCYDPQRLKSGLPKRLHHLADYAFFMDCLVDRAEDIVVLEDAKIVLNWRGSEEMATSMFNQLTVEVNWDSGSNYLSRLFVDVREHSDSRPHRWRAKLVRDYFSTPWSIISLAAAFVLLILTLLQTVYTMKSYLHF
ncbi:UPF0481 protein [Acorus calamus]|uniref:UPF0481 protein n=1 Tax=Acorus calamus TaxID=4465 RepID=A0AAV9CFD8_ACOCL|nr:UPF0481 protein [Acorus calamus]